MTYLRLRAVGLDEFFEGGGDDAVVGVLTELLEFGTGSGVVKVAES
jgi:hypothetical protein